MNWQQNQQMMLTVLDLKNATPSNHALKHAIKQTKMKKIYHNLKKFATIVEKILTMF